MALLILALVVVRDAGSDERLAPAGSGPTLTQVRRLFPAADQLGDADRGAASREVLDADGRLLGSVLRTAPYTDDLRGYAGPSDVLVALDADGVVAAVALIDSDDTLDHVRAVEEAAGFWDAFVGWRPAHEPLAGVDAVSGSTLTSLAIAEGVERRLAGSQRSRRFPAALTVDEARGVWPRAARLGDEVRGRAMVFAADGSPLGQLLRTSPAADNLRGYRGPTEALVGIGHDTHALVGLSLRDSYDTPGFVERVAGDADFLERLSRAATVAGAELDLAAAGIEGVSGATRTSWALAEGLRLSLAEAAPAAAGVGARDLALAALVLGAVLLALGPGRGRPGWRRAWQVVLVLGYGVALGDLLSLALVVGWARHGLPSAGLALLAAACLLTPLLSGRQLYCHALCPHGALQEWVGRLRRRSSTLPRVWVRRLSLLPWWLLGTAFLAAAWPGVVDLDPARLEAFDAWSLGTAAVVSCVLAVVGLLACLVLPMAYCRLGCPTGALLQLFGRRRPGWGRRDTLAALLVLGVGCGRLWNAPSAGPAETVIGDLGAAAHGLRTADLGGRAFGTTWSVRLRDPSVDRGLWQQRCADELARLEGEFSSWRADSEVAAINASATTAPLLLSPELLELLRFAAAIVEASAGAFDPTVGPLVDAWGAGPSGPDVPPPDGAALAALRERTGWSQLTLDGTAGTLTKAHPDLQLDLGALLQGHAADRLAAAFREADVGDVLVEVGGELIAVGRWTVAVEDPDDPDRPLLSLPLRDAALATSGPYRLAHIVSPRTGRPVEAPWTLVSVQADAGRLADAWATALLVSGEAAPALAERHGLAALFHGPGGTLRIGGF